MPRGVYVRKAINSPPSGTTILKECKYHGLTEHHFIYIWKNGKRMDNWSKGARCSRCRNEGVKQIKRNHKAKLVLELGGKCILCGYDKNIKALQFHHLDRATKYKDLSYLTQHNSYAKCLEEALKCILICANCHAEITSPEDRMPLRSDLLEGQSILG